MKRALSALLCAAAVVLALLGVGAAVRLSLPDYPDAIGLEATVTEKITGETLIRLAAAEDDELLVFGSSELKTADIATHPANFFADRRCGFQVDLVGRGSCQSLVHALYYEQVRKIVSGYDNVRLLDLTPYEYEPYFLCDTMHLGWKGWLEVDRAMAEFALEA